MPMLFQLQLLAYRLMKPFMKPLSWIVAIPRPILFVGPGSAARLCRLIGGSGARRTLIVTDSMLVKLGLVEPVQRWLEADGIDVAVFDSIVPVPTHYVLDKGAAANLLGVPATRTARSTTPLSATDRRDGHLTDHRRELLGGR